MTACHYNCWPRAPTETTPSQPVRRRRAEQSHLVTMRQEPVSLCSSTGSPVAVILPPKWPAAGTKAHHLLARFLRFLSLSFLLPQHPSTPRATRPVQKTSPPRTSVSYRETGCSNRRSHSVQSVTEGYVHGLLRDDRFAVGAMRRVRSA